ncbi:MAG: hydroxymethylglutaryl-CoA lyase [Myxococcales bacterium]|nr:hydroxymethylglutaryl-CoA lyase [Myxococcales bacterium]|tara:strand:+ start:82 stop:1002 length:921 start_codon:yes stop_codon:yes gene_type:complete
MELDGEQLRLMEVGPRDGLQNESTQVSVADKTQFITLLKTAGLKRIEAGALVHPKWIPSMAHSQEVIASLNKSESVSYAALVPNMVGFERAIEAGVHEVSLVLSVSDTHNQKNINASTSDALERYRPVAERAIDLGVPFRAYVSCAFGCPYEGPIAVPAVVAVAEKLLELGAYELSIGDTIGVGNPKQTHELVRALKESVPVNRLAMHLHDTRGTALANMLAAYQEGVRSFDSAAGGLGGCPYAPGASGNVATEDVVWMFESMGIDTGVDLNVLVNASEMIQSALGRDLPSKAFQAMMAQRQDSKC